MKVVAAASFIAAPLLAASGAADAASTHSTALPTILTCSNTRVTRPASFIISCADANTELTKMHWSTWSATAASASGTYTFNDCTPYCAAGHFHSDPATVSLSKVVATAHGREFSLLKVTYRTGAKTTKSFTFPLTTK